MTVADLHVAPVRRLIPAQVGRWPGSRVHRWGMRIALGLPFMVVAVVADLRGIRSEPNQALAVAGEAIDWGASDLGFVADAYPPIPTGMAAVVPNSAIWNGLIGALCAGIVLQLLWERLHVRRVPATTTFLLVASVALIPPFVYASTQDLVAFMGLAFFSLAVSGLVRFAVDGDTEGGFQCGLALGVAAMCDPATFVVALCLGAAAPLIAWRRYREQPGALVSTMIVVTFPTVAAMLGWAFVEWRFTGGAFHTVRADPAFLAFPGGVTATVARELGALGIRLLITPVFVVCAVLLAARRPIAVGAQLLALAVIVITKTLGINYGSGQGVLLLAFIAVMTVEQAPSRARRLLVGAACVAQLALQWYPWRPNTAVYQFVDHLLR